MLRSPVLFQSRFGYRVVKMQQPTTAKIHDKKTKTAEVKLQKILNRIKLLKLKDGYVSHLEIRKFSVSGKTNYLFHGKFTFIYGGLILFLSMFLKFYFDEWATKNCLLEVPSSSKTLFRAPEDCSMCLGVDSVVRVANVSSQEFEEQFAYGTAPVIVTDAMDGWTANDKFDFKFFAEFYQNGKMGVQTNDCFFFAYKSGLRSLHEVFQMDEARANLSGDPWYVGWSTCYSEETRALRSYYQRPYFLPKTAESDMVDWIFMGGPGQGAHMHVDSVRHKSWQAQVRGRKQWQLAPPPECLYQCKWISFTVEPTEILVVDTNRWYHKTNVLPGDISITIGAEYD